MTCSGYKFYFKDKSFDVQKILSSFFVFVMSLGEREKVFFSVNIDVKENLIKAKERKKTSSILWRWNKQRKQTGSIALRSSFPESSAITNMQSWCCSCARFCWKKNGIQWVLLWNLLLADKLIQFSLNECYSSSAESRIVIYSP